jgi:hypothetical protein
MLFHTICHSTIPFGIVPMFFPIFPMVFPKLSHGFPHFSHGFPHGEPPKISVSESHRGAVCAAAQQASAAIAKDGQIFAWGFAGQARRKTHSDKLTFCYGK